MKNKRLITLLLTFVMAICVISADVFAADGYTADNGLITINCNVSGISEGTTVALMIVPQIFSGDTDVTVATVQAVSTISELNSLELQYVTMLEAGAAGKIEHICRMKANAPTGWYHIIVINSANNQAEAIDEPFGHVNAGELSSFISNLNGEGDYSTIIADAFENLKMINPTATAFYESCPNKADFNAILKTKKTHTEGGMFTNTNINAIFNEAIAWYKLSNDANTLSVLNAYNTGYWNLELSGADFTSLTAEEKDQVADRVKAQKPLHKDALARAFNKEVAVKLFNKATDRDDITSLIDVNGKYKDFFVNTRQIISDANLSQYDNLKMLNNVLTGNTTCNNFTEIENLFRTYAHKYTDGGAGGNRVDNNSDNWGISNKGNGGGTVSKPQNAALPFIDITHENWAYAYVERLYREKVIHGVSTTNFAPTADTSREAFVKMLVGILKLPLSDEKSVFSDIPSGDYFEPFVMTAYKNGLIQGVDSEQFGMNTTLKRKDAAVILHRIFVKRGIVEQGRISFNDMAETPDYAKEAVGYVGAVGIFKGDDKGNFNPNSSLSRSEACAVLCRAADIIAGR